jgi:putative transposase
MPLSPHLTVHRPRRLPEHSYDSGAYFVTMKTAGRARLFGRVAGDRVVLSPEGEVVQREWLRSMVLRSDVTTDEFVVMPDHFHGIVILQPARAAPDGVRRTFSLGAMMAGFKASCTSAINRHRDTPGAQVWQSRYHEWVVRDAAAMERIRQYIRNNPAAWSAKHGDG